MSDRRLHPSGAAGAFSYDAPAKLVDELFRAIEAWDATHREWLHEALLAFFDGKPVPAPRSGAINTRRPSAWQTMDSAPKDGTLILLYPHMMSGWWEFGDESWQVLHIRLNDDRTVATDWDAPPRRWHCLTAVTLGGEPTHWQPLPTPPDETS